MLPIKLLLVAAVAGPAAAFLWAGASSYHLTVAAATQRLIQTTDLVREHAQKVFDTQRLVLALAADQVRDLPNADIRAQEATLHARFQAILDGLPQLGDLTLFDEAGVALVSARVYPLPRPGRYADRDYIRAFRNGFRGFYVSSLLQARADGVPFFNLSTDRHAPDGTFAGVASVSIRPGYFEEFYQRIEADSPSLILSMVREHGDVLVRVPPAAGSLAEDADSAFLHAIAEHPDHGSYRIAAAEGQPVQRIAYRRLDGLPVYVRAALSEDAMLSDWRQDVAHDLLFGIPATLGLVALAAVALARTRRERRALGRAAEEARRREQAEAAMRQSQKMEAVGRLTAGIAHDFNNLLTVIGGSLDLIERRLGAVGPDLGRHLAAAQRGTDRATTLVQRLLAFSRQQALTPKPVDVNALLAGMVDLVRRMLGERIAVETVLGADLWPTRVDANQLESSILNLAVNARDAMPGGGCLTIETANARLDAADGDIEPGDYVTIAVTDTGQGMSEDVVARAFEPFFTTKATGQGTGLGLSQVYGFVKQSGGHVRIRSAIGRGTTVRLYLPRLNGEPVADPKPAAASVAPGSGVVLVVEDDADVRAYSAALLAELGYRVLEAPDGPAALDVLARIADVDVLFTDLGLAGGMSGRELAVAARARRPALKLLYTTGYAHDSAVAQSAVEPGSALLLKPFTLADLAARLREVLHAG